MVLTWRRYYGSRANFNTVIAPLLVLMDAIAERTETYVQRMTWIQSLQDLAGGSLSLPATGYDQHDTFYAKSIVTKASTPLSLAALQGLSTYLTYTTPPSGSGWMVIWDLYGGPGSAFSAKAQSSSSFPHRDAGYVGQFYAWNYNGWVPQTINHVKGMVDALGSEVSGLGAYAPYTDPELGTEAKTRYWGAAGVTRLQALRQTWDATDLWLSPQGF